MQLMKVNINSEGETLGLMLGEIRWGNNTALGIMRPIAGPTGK